MQGLFNGLVVASSLHMCLLRVAAISINNLRQIEFRA